MPTDPIRLSEINGFFDVPTDLHRICVDPGDLQVLLMPFDGTHAGAKFIHPNIIRSRRKNNEYKHSDKTGHKWWTKRAGVTHVFAVPRSEVLLLPDESSWLRPVLEIGGQQIVMNTCSGSGTPKGWSSSRIKVVEDTCANHQVAVLKAVAAIAVRGSQFEGYKWEDELVEEFFKQHRGQLLTCGSSRGYLPGEATPPPGMLFVWACIDGFRAPYDTPRRYFLMPEEEYPINYYPGFVIDPTRYQEVENPLPQER